MAYTGEIVEIPLGQNGLTGTHNIYNAAPTYLVQATNVTFEPGTIQKEGGAVKYNANVFSGSPQIMSGWDWWPNETTQRMIFYSSSGSLGKDFGGSPPAVILTAGLPTDQTAIFVEAGKEAAASNRKLIIFIPTTAPRVLAADSPVTTALATPPADWSGTNQPTFGVAHEGRLWAAGNPNDPHRLYFSTLTNHEDFTGAGSGTVAVFPGEGERLVGAVSYKGLLIAFKYPRGIYAIDTSSPTLSQWRVARLNNVIGGVSPLGHVLIDDDILFMDATGAFHLLSGITEFGNIGSRNLSHIADLMPFVRENVNLSHLHRTQAVYYTAKREVHFAVPGTGSDHCNRRLVIDLNRPDLPRFRWSDRDANISLWLRKDANNIPRIVMGDATGTVWLLDQDTRSKDGAGYTATFQTTPTDFSYLDPRFATIRKSGQFLEFIAEPLGEWSITVKVFWDGRLSQTLSFAMAPLGTGLGSFVLGTNWLASAQVRSVKRRITGSGRLFSIEVSNSGASQNFSLSRAFLHFVPGDERLN